MPSTSSWVDVSLDVVPGSQPALAVQDPEAPFRIAILGDFSGRASRGIEGIRPPIEVDRDNFDAVMAKLGVELRIPVAGAIRFRDLDDFHPDRLYATLDMFAGLREAAVAAPGPTPSVPVERASEPPRIGLEGLLDRAVEETTGRAEGGRSEVADDFQRWLKERVAPHLQRGEDAAAVARRTLVEQAASVQMRALMHFPAFQALEAAWRLLFFLARRIDTDETLRLYLIDVSKDELAGDLGRSGDWRESAIGRTLLESSAGVMGGNPWSLLTGNYTFGPSADDLNLLARLGTMAASLGAPWLAGAAPDLMREPVKPAWAELRRSAVARWIGLAWPRFLLRVPYGKDTDACERFAFEEMPEAAEHERYLWGNPAFACTALLAMSFRERGWSFRPGMHSNLEGLPLDVRSRDGEKRAQPCAEFLMSEAGAEHILESGIMPLASLKDTDEVRLVRFQSIAFPAAALAGRWGSRAISA
jgi:type VI secretion system protein ImpC